MIFHNHLIMHSLQISSDSPLFKNAKAVTYLLRGAGLARVYIRSALRTYLISVSRPALPTLPLVCQCRYVRYTPVKKRFVTPRNHLPQTCNRPM